MADVTLLPGNSTDQEKNLELSTARIGDVQTPLRELWNADTCPENLLPWLAWALSLDSWDSTWPVDVKRQRIKSAIEVAKHKGTAKSVRDVAKSFGANVSVIEWFQQSPQGAPYTFQVLLTVGSGAPATPEYQQQIIDEITRVKPVRSTFTFTAGQSATGSVGLQGAGRIAVYRRLEMTG